MKSGFNGGMWPSASRKTMRAFFSGPSQNLTGPACQNDAAFVLENNARIVFGPSQILTLTTRQNNAATEFDNNAWDISVGF
jgi:hypothetical protein